MNTNTVADKFGPEIADKLARMAIDLACAAPLRDGKTVDVKVRWSLIRETRAILDEAGVDWRMLTQARMERDKEAFAENRERRLRGD